MASLAHAALFGVGAYVAAGLAVRGLDPTLAVIAATGAGFGVGRATAWITTRFRGDHFILGTLAVQLLATAFFYEARQVTGGASGIAGIPRPHVWGAVLHSPMQMLIWVALLGSMSIGFVIWLSRTPFARALELGRDSMSAAVALGKNPQRLRIGAASISGSVGALAGAMYALYIQYIDPTTFSIEQSILVLSLVVIGGSATTLGPIVGAAFGVAVPEILRLMELPSALSAHLQLMVYGAIVVLLMHIRPQGLAGRYGYD